MIKKNGLTICSLLTTFVGMLGACSNREIMEPCKFFETESTEFDAEFNSMDDHTSEVEMVCGDRAVEVTSAEFRRKLGINPQLYQKNLREFEQKVNCFSKKTTAEKVVVCRKVNNDQGFQILNYHYDD